MLRGRAWLESLWVHPGVELVGTGSFQGPWDPNYHRFSCVLHVLSPAGAESCLYDKGSAHLAHAGESLGNYDTQFGCQTHKHQTWDLISLSATLAVAVTGKGSG